MIPNTPENLEKIKAIGEDLLGTCGHLDNKIAEVFGEGIDMMLLDQALLEAFDEITMECQLCGWWCETGDLDDDCICSDCTEE
jgi:hypothetical protein